jgi:putative Ca2+/H+ antiporter (TMEM165/GDT1 family)
LEALLTAFIAAALGEIGDKTQLLVVALAVHYRKPGAVLAGVAVAALVNNGIAAAAGGLIRDEITLRATSLLLAVALLFAAATCLLQPPRLAQPRAWKAPAFLAAAIGFFGAELGDKTQFLTAVISAQFGFAALAAAGATAGVLAANAPAAILGERFAGTLPLRPIRYAAGGLFLAAGLIVAVNALRLT